MVHSNPHVFRFKKRTQCQVHRAHVQTRGRIHQPPLPSLSSQPCPPTHGAGGAEGQAPGGRSGLAAEAQWQCWPEPWGGLGALFKGAGCAGSLQGSGPIERLSPHCAEGGLPSGARRWVVGRPPGIVHCRFCCSLGLMQGLLQALGLLLLSKKSPPNKNSPTWACCSKGEFFREPEVRVFIGCLLVLFNFSIFSEQFWPNVTAPVFSALVKGERSPNGFSLQCRAAAADGEAHAGPPAQEDARRVAGEGPADGCAGMGNGPFEVRAQPGDPVDGTWRSSGAGMVLGTQAPREGAAQTCPRLMGALELFPEADRGRKAQGGAVPPMWPRAGPG